MFDNHFGWAIIQAPAELHTLLLSAKDNIKTILSATEISRQVVLMSFIMQR